MSAPTRRALLGGIGMTSIAAAAVAIPVASPASDQTAWDRAYARCRRAETAYTAAANRCDDAEAALSQRCAEIAPTGLRDIVGLSQYTQLHFTDLGQLACLYEPPHVAKFGGGEAIRTSVEAYRKRRLEIFDELGIKSLDATTNAAVSECRAAFAALLETPPPTIAALAEKLAEAAEHDLDDEHVLVLAADARRLAGVA